MDFELTQEQKMIERAAKELAEDFGPEYWREKDQNHEFPEEFFGAAADAGFLAGGIPEEYGGAGLGMLESAVSSRALASGGCGVGGPWTIGLTSLFGGVSITTHGDEKQKEKWLPKMVSGEVEFCMGLTEPDAGTNLLNIQTHAEKEGDEYRINGEKIFISGADRADGMLLVTRTKSIGEVENKTQGITLFLVDLPQDSVEIKPIPKHGINYAESCEVYIDDLYVPEENILGEEGMGLFQIFDVLNPERIGTGAVCIGTAELAIKTAAEYANEREVFGQPIGAHQGVQFPLAEAYSKIQSAWAFVQKAAWMYDNDFPSRKVGANANMAKLTAVEASIEGVYHAMQTFGGYGYAVEYDVERWWREINLWRLAPVTQQMALNFIGENVLGLPRSYKLE